MNIFISDNENIKPLKIAVNILILAVVLVSILWIALSRVGISFDFSFARVYHIRLIDGLVMTIGISLGSLVFSLLLGIVSAITSESKVLILRYLSKFYVTIIRGTPLIVQIYLFYYIIGTALGVENRFIAGIIILSIFSGAYISEIIRGSLSSIDKTQIEAAKAVGFTRGETVRYVILPQMVTRTLPALTGQFASIIKDSSLLSIIALIEITQTIRELTALNFKFFEAYFILGGLYLLLTLPITILSQRIERKFSYENKS